MLLSTQAGRAPASGYVPQPGYDDPVAGAQSAFRAALHALAHPGTLVRTAPPRGVPPGLSPAMTALLLTLADADTPLWLPPGTDRATLGYLRFHCASPMADDPAEARFVAVPAGAAPPPLAACRQGEPAYPDRSATLLLEVQSLTAGRAVTLRGPGIAARAPLAAAGLPGDFWRQWRDNHGRFPLGVDVLLTCGDQLCGLPRTTLVEE